MNDIKQLKHLVLNSFSIITLIHHKTKCPFLNPINPRESLKMYKYKMNFLSPRFNGSLIIKCMST